ncbi:MAG: hypothetical protein JKY37_08655 [Nannocystaceae bacterium]|nr:hypothetical protein [Nannocystaceae bacterium]
MEFPIRVLCLGLVTLALGCGDDGGADGGGSGEADETAADTVSDSMDDVDDADTTTDPGSSDDSTNNGPCGNGVVDSGEECDDGEANSDTTPDACREDCRFPQCSDGIIDPGQGEECDNGGDNANLEADACRTNCLLPRCGDGGVDTGEACDDGNEAWGDSCFECSARFYFILNAPDMTGGGDVSIIRTTRDGSPIELVGGDPSYNGIWQLALEPDGTTIYALQSDGATDRVLLFSGEDGALQSEVDIGEATLGYDPEARGIVRAANGLLYVALTGNGSVRLISVDPARGVVTEAIDFGSTFEIADMTHDLADGIYITTGPGNSVIRADISAGTTATFADGDDGLSNPVGIGYDDGAELLEIANGGSPTDIMSCDLAGNVMLVTSAMENIGDEVPALAIDVGGVISAVVPSQDRIVGLELLGGVQSLFTEMVNAPLDLEILELPDVAR